MRRKAFWVLAVALLVAIAASAVYAGWKCDYDGNARGTVGKQNNLSIDMGTVVFSDVDSGATTKVLWPMNYDQYIANNPVGHWGRHEIQTPTGNFKLRMSVKLSGRKSFGIWSSKRNTVKVDVRKGDASGPIVATQSLDRNAGSPVTTLVELPQVTASLTAGSSQQYTVMLRYDKYDGNSSNDNQCGGVITVRAEP